MKRTMAAIAALSLLAVPTLAQTTQPAPDQLATEPAVTPQTISPADDDDYDWGWLGLLGLLGLTGLMRRNGPAVIVRDRTEPETTGIKTRRDV